MEYKAFIEINFIAPDDKGKLCIEDEIDALITILYSGNLANKQDNQFAYKSIKIKEVKENGN